MERTKWFDRTFKLDFPVGLFPTILERLHGTTARLKEMTAHITEEEAEYKSGDKWSIKEHIGHLSDLEDLHDGRIDDFLAHKDILRPADLKNAATYDAQHNNSTIAALIDQFAKKRKEFTSRLHQLSDETHEIKALHPRLKVMMRPVDMAYFTAEHDDHHLTSIRELIK